MTHAIYKPRSAWGARPARSGPGSLLVSRVRGVAIHWPGSGETDSFDQDAEVASALRGWQAFHMDGRKWSDIAYNVAVAQDGDAWTLRGLYTQSGANGDLTLNQQYVAILLVLIADEEPSEAMKRTVRKVIQDVRDIYGEDADLIVPHSAIRGGGTDCPGPKARAAITAGYFEPRAEPQPPKEEEDPMAAVTIEGVEALIKKYMVGDNKYDSQRAAWEAAAAAYTTHRFEELVKSGKSARQAFDLVRDEVWGILRPLWTDSK